MKIFSNCKALAFLLVLFFNQINAQNFDVVERCGGTSSVDIPDFIDNDLDGLSDSLEQILLNHFVPPFVQFSDEDCPGPDTGASLPTDTNLVVCRIFPLFQQYTATNDITTLQSTPTSLVNENCLNSGMVWYDNRIVIYGALLYGRDCGLNGHIADVEGFSISLKYVGPDDNISWRSDTMISNWEGVMLQTISHANTPCQQVETFPYRNQQNPTGKDTIFCSPDKHGNYLTRTVCNSTFGICNPGCNNSYTIKNVMLLNVGEEAASFITDLGIYFSEYAGENPWGDTDFLGGGAGMIKSKMLDTWRSDFMPGQAISSCSDICAVYAGCQTSCGIGAYNACVNDCSDIPNNQTGCNSPVFDCSLAINENAGELAGIKVFPNPARTELNIVFPKQKDTYSLIMRNLSGQVVKTLSCNSSKTRIDLTGLSKGVYLLQIENSKFQFSEQQVVIE